MGAEVGRIREMNDRLEPRIRILLGSSIAIGPGKAALLEGIADTGSIAGAGRRMGMSYRRAWVLTKSMNACFREPLIEAAKGGIGGGGARLTAMGREVLALYRAVEDHAATAVIPDMEKLRKLMADQPPEE
jgi:molybdate transport system regulatory protein